MDKRALGIFAAGVTMLGLSAMASTPTLQGEMRAPRILYQIFTRSFQDSGDDGIGDLDGITSRLDYVAGLGADAIWLTPIFQSDSYHGYDTINYEMIQSEYGDLDGFDRLVHAAHDRGIRVLLDLVVNHTSVKHPWFREPNLYIWNSEPLHWSQAGANPGSGPPEDLWHEQDGQYYFSTFGEGVADLDWRNPEVLDRVERVIDFWVGRGTDGFRLDAAKFLIKGPDGEPNQPETHSLWREMVAHTRLTHPGTYFIGEIWDSAANIAPYYGNADELDSAFDFPVADALRRSLESGTGAPFADALREQLATERAPFFASPFLGNHDMSRIASVVHGNLNRLKLGALAILTLPGTVTLYAGDEIGLPNGNGQQDLKQRTPMQWSNQSGFGFTPPDREPWVDFATDDPRLTVEAQAMSPSSLLNTYRDLIRVRRETAALNEGLLTEINEPAPGVVSYVRALPSGKSALVVLNFNSRWTRTFCFLPRARHAGKIRRIYGQVVSRELGPDGGLRFCSIAPESGAIFLI